MEALILSCGTGGGHNAAGAAIMEELQRRGHQVQMCNPYTLRSTRLSQRIDHTYIGLVQRAPWAFGFVYCIGNLYRRLPFRSPVYFANRAMGDTLAEYFAAHHVDLVIMPHLFPAEILTNMKAHGHAVPKMMFVATDYVCTPFTEETDCDAYVIPSAALACDFVRRGIPQDKLHPLGIPSKAQFHTSLPRSGAKRQLGLDEKRKYILVIGGSMGAGSLVQIARRLLSAPPENAGIIVICGSNQKLYRRLQKKFGAQLILVQQTDQMAAYMKACDWVLSKPGGLSSTEAAVAQTALLHITPIPGCETRNMRYFAENGLSIPIRHRRQLLPALQALSTPEAQTRMKKRQREVINAHAAADICDLAEQMVQIK